jgi:hypothetical protein
MFGAGVFFARIALPALLAFAVMTGAERVAGTSPVRSPVQPTSVVWANRIFATKADLARWLRSHGASYQTWASAHPALAAPQEGKPAQRVADSRSSSTKGEDPTHLIALGVAFGVALVLGLILLYQRRLYDFRGSLQRGAAPVPATPSAGRPPRRGRRSYDFRGTLQRSTEPAPATASADRPARRPRRLVPAPAGSVPARELATSVRVRLLQPAAAAAKAVAYGAGPTLLSVARSGAESRGRLRLFRREHPDLAWYIGACTFAVVVGLAIPFFIR